MPDLPRTTATIRGYLRRLDQATPPIHVYRDPARPGAGVSRTALDRMVRDGLVVLGGHTAPTGRPVTVTDLGRAVLAAHPES